MTPASQTTINALASLAKMFADHFGPDPADCLNRLAESSFLTTYEQRPDAEHWETLLPFIKRLALVYRASQIGKLAEAIADPELDYDDLDERSAWFIHMIDAFDRGDRFLVAKLSYAGGEA